MVVFVRHTLLLGSVGFDIDNVANAEVDKVGREFDETLLCKPEVSQKGRETFDKTTHA